MSDWTTLRSQSGALLQMNGHRAVGHPRMRTREEERGLLAAYLWLAREPQGQMILDHLAERLLMFCDGPHDEGARRLVLTILERIATAQQLLSEEEGAYG